MGALLNSSLTASRQTSQASKEAERRTASQPGSQQAHPPIYQVVSPVNERTNETNPSVESSKARLRRFSFLSRSASSQEAVFAPVIDSTIALECLPTSDRIAQSAIDPIHQICHKRHELAPISWFRGQIVSYRNDPK